MESDKDKLRSLCMENAQQLFNELSPAINERLEFELYQIAGLEMENTFLLCYEIAQSINQNKGLIGPSPALSSSSLVLYLLGVSMVNPMEQGLLFEHFFPVDRVDTIAIGMEVDKDSLKLIRNRLKESYFHFDNIQLEEPRLCDSLEISIGDNQIIIYESAALTDLVKRKFTGFANIPLDDKRVFQKLVNVNHIASLREVKRDFLSGFNAAQQEFLIQYAPKSIVELAQVLVYLKPWCNYDFDSILKRRKGVYDLTQFQKRYFNETDGIYTFPEQVGSMLQRYLEFSKHQSQSYQRAVRKKVSKLHIACEELFFRKGTERNYDQIDLEQIWYNMIHYNKSMTDKTRVVGEALLLYWWVWAKFHKPSTHN